MKRSILHAVLACAAVAMPATLPTAASARAVSKDGFSFPADRALKVAVFRPDVRVGSLRVGGLDEPNSEWTAAARKNLQAALEASTPKSGLDVSFLGDPEGPDAELLTRYRSLFETVSGAVMQHQFLGDGLPTKLAPPIRDAAGKVSGKRYRLDWTLGADAARLKSVTGADYAMFVFTHDSYGDAGRKVAQLLMAGLFGAYVPAGIHIGYAGLVDLSTGDIVWFNTDLAMGGDVREAEGAAKRVSQLLSGLPAAKSQPAAPQKP